MPQMPLGAVPIAEIEFDVFCRHELVPILMALQHQPIYHRGMMPLQQKNNQKSNFLEFRQ